MYIHLYIKVSLIVYECSRTAIQDTLKPWCLGSYADLAYSSYSDVFPPSLFRLAWGHGLAGVVWHGGRGLACLRAEAAASYLWESDVFKNWPHITYIALLPASRLSRTLKQCCRFKASPSAHVLRVKNKKRES